MPCIGNHRFATYLPACSDGCLIEDLLGDDRERGDDDCESTGDVRFMAIYRYGRSISDFVSGEKKKKPYTDRGKCLDLSMAVGMGLVFFLSEEVKSDEYYYVGNKI